MSLSPEIRQRILSNIKKRVLANHINVAGVDYQDWFQSIDKQRTDLLASGEEDFEDRVRRILQELKSSHTAFYHELPSRFGPQHTINATLSSVESNGREVWMFLDVYPGGPAHNAGVKPGDLLIEVDGVAQNPPEMPAFAIDKRHELAICQGPQHQQRSIIIQVPHAKGTKQRPPIVEPKSVTHSMLQPGVGLLKVVYFSGALGMRFSSELDSAISDLKARACDRLVVDLRGNIGGSLGFARLASYLCPDRRPIGHSLTPKRLRTGYTLDQLPRVPMPQNRAELAMALTRFAFKDKSLVLLTQGLGRQPFHGRTVLLINEWTNSAAEIVAAFAQEAGLATVVGQKTRGNVLGAANFSVGGGYWLRLPVFGWFTSKGTTLEGVGVQPDIDVEVLGAHSSFRDMQMSRAVEITATL